MGLLVRVVAWFSSAGFTALASGVVSVLNKRSDSAVAINKDNVAAGQAVDIAQLNAATAAMHESAALATLRWGWWGTRYLLLFIALPPAFHSAQIYLDSCAVFFPIFGAGFFSLEPVYHLVGSWHVGRAPGVYEGQELSILATCVGIMTAQHISDGIVGAIIRKKGS